MGWQSLMGSRVKSRGVDGSGLVDAVGADVVGQGAVRVAARKLALVPNPTRSITLAVNNA